VKAVDIHDRGVGQLSGELGRAAGAVVPLVAGLVGCCLRLSARQLTMLVSGQAGSWWKSIQHIIRQ